MSKEVSGTGRYSQFDNDRTISAREKHRRHSEKVDKVMGRELLTRQLHNDLKIIPRKIWKGVRQLLRKFVQLDRKTGERFRKKLGKSIVVVVVRYWNGIIQL